MIYNYITHIDVTDRFIYVVIITVIILLFSRIPISPYLIVGTIVGIIVVYYIHDKKIYTGNTFLASMKNILNSDLMKPKSNRSLYKDSELVAFLDNRREYYNYNPNTWNQLVKHINEFLRLQSDIEIGVVRFNMDYETLVNLKGKILNSYHAFIYTVPHTPNSIDKFHIGMRHLQKLLNRNIDITHKKVALDNSKDINIDTKFHYKNHPHPQDEHDTQYNYF
jgi:hypothetical protein